MANYEELDRGMSQYFKSLKKFEPLSKEEERQLLIDYKLHKDISARNRLIEANLKYTCKLVKEYCGNGLSFSELLSEANDGLMYAIDKYDLNENVKLICYSKHWTRQRMEDAIKKKQRYTGISDIVKSNNGMDRCNLDELLGSVDADEDDNAMRIEDRLGDEKKFITDVLSVLNERERDIFILNYGIGGGEPMSLAKIAKKYGITRERVRQIMDTGLRKLRSEALVTKTKIMNDIE